MSGSNNSLTALEGHGLTGISPEMNYSKRWSPDTPFTHGHVAKYIGNRVQESPPEASRRDLAMKLIDPTATAFGTAGQMGAILQVAPVIAAPLGIAAAVGWVVNSGIDAATHIHGLTKAGHSKVPDAGRADSRDVVDETQLYLTQKEKQKDYAHILRDGSDGLRLCVGIASNVASLFTSGVATLVSAALGIASGVLGVLVGGATFAVYSLKAQAFGRHLKKAKELKLAQTNDPEKGRLFKILDKLRLDRFRQQRKSAKFMAGVYAAIGALGGLGAVIGGLSLAGLISASVVTAGAVPAAIFMGGLILWGVVCAVRTVKAHRVQKALHSELKRNFEKLRQEGTWVEKLEAEIQEGWAKYQRQPKKTQRLANLDKELFHHQSEFREAARRVDYLLEKYLESNPQAAVASLLRLLAPQENSVFDAEVRNYFKSRCKDEKRFEGNLRLLEKHWKAALIEQKQLQDLQATGSKQTHAQQGAFKKAEKKAVKTACKILGL